ncbi:putative serine/threonine-protein kinase Nek4 [Apostichopus japonicus]|uniref:non-specific serine/threonine protein kinase n=1 Tax=Stichopus japonicus TaxID=307972 RepID=A0A2G8K6K3_STIJA|nr:putative serine/threonine-protein kinase Nek4 [Apostichopus japonicus]
MHQRGEESRQTRSQICQLRHPNIVSYRDSFNNDDGHLYIVMGYCDGGDVYNRLKQQKGRMLEERQVVEWFVQIAMALQYMHERNILHRDLKTQNIFLTKSKIIKSDVWALGCCVYEMATLKHAFNAKDMNSLVYKILRGKMPAMPQTYGKELVEIIKAMLHQSPDKRPSVARILRNPYIKKHIAMFLEGTRARRPSSAGIDGRRGSRPEITDLAGSGSSSRPTTANHRLEKPGMTAASSHPSQKHLLHRPSSGGDANRRSASSKKDVARKSSVPYKTPSKSGAEQASTPRKTRPLPAPPSKAGTPRTSTSSKKRVSSAPSAERSRSSSSSSVSSSRDERSINSSARARRRELRESQEHTGTPVVSASVGSRESSSSRDETDSVSKKKRVTHTRSDPSSVAAKQKDRSKDEDKETDNSSSSGEEDNPEQVKRREEKEIKKFSSLLETTLRLNEKQSNGDRDSPESVTEEEEAKDHKVINNEFQIAPAAPRAPKGIGNATMTTSGRLMDRIAALRKDIMAGVGIEMLQKAYEIFDNEEGDNIEPLLVKLLGRKDFEIYGGKIWQLKFCEETVFG